MSVFLFWSWRLVMIKRYLFWRRRWFPDVEVPRRRIQTKRRDASAISIAIVK